MNPIEGMDGTGEFNDPPGGSCMAKGCSIDAVVQLDVAVPHRDERLKLCGVHQLELARTGAITVRTRDPAHLHVDDGRLIRKEDS